MCNLNKTLIYQAPSEQTQSRHAEDEYGGWVIAKELVQTGSQHWVQAGLDAESVSIIKTNLLTYY